MKRGLFLFGVVVVLSSCTKNEETLTSDIREASTYQSVVQSTTISSVQETDIQHVQTYEKSDLLNATKQNDLEAIKTILAVNSQLINETDDLGNTALMIAVQNNYIDSANYLIDKQADVNRQNNIQDSPYLYAGAEGRTEILAYMLKNSIIDFSKVNRFGGNALIPAAEKGHLENVQILLKDGRNPVDFQNNYGYTALIEVVALRENNENYRKIIDLLLAYGASPTIRDNYGKSALDYAREKNYQDVYNKLRGASS